MSTAVQIEACIQRRDDSLVATDGDDLERKRAIARRIAQAREAAGLNANQLATKCGTTWPHVQRWERTTGAPPTTPGPKHLQRIAETTGVSVGWLLGTERETLEAADAYPVLADFLASIEGKGVTPSEREQLRAQRWKNPPTTHSYHYLLQAIRSGVSPADAAAEAAATEAAFSRAIARGGKPLKKGKR